MRPRERSHHRVLSRRAAPTPLDLRTLAGGTSISSPSVPPPCRPSQLRCRRSRPSTLPPPSARPPHRTSRLPGTYSTSGPPGALHHRLKPPQQPVELLLCVLRPALSPPRAPPTSLTPPARRSSPQPSLAARFASVDPSRLRLCRVIPAHALARLAALDLPEPRRTHTPPRPPRRRPPTLTPDCLALRGTPEWTLTRKSIGDRVYERSPPRKQTSPAVPPNSCGGPSFRPQLPPPHTLEMWSFAAIHLVRRRSSGSSRRSNSTRATFRLSQGSATRRYGTRSFSKGPERHNPIRSRTLLSSSEATSGRRPSATASSTTARPRPSFDCTRRRHRE